LTKNILGAVDHVWMAIPTMFLPAVVYWAPLMGILVGLWKSGPALMAAGGLAYAIQLALLLPVSRIGTIRWAKAIFFPAAAAPVICCFTKALYRRVSGSVWWRGRVVTVSRTEARETTLSGARTGDRRPPEEGPSGVQVQRLNLPENEESGNQ
jgi:hypothetical protein